MSASSTSKLDVRPISRTFNAYHLGDNLVHLHFLRKVALANQHRHFVHAAREQYIYELSDIVDDVPNLDLIALESDPYHHVSGSWDAPFCQESVNAWRGTGDFWYNHKHRNDFVRFHTEHWFPHLAKLLEVENPIRCAADMLFDYFGATFCERQPLPRDLCLFINSAPHSGQFRDFDIAALNNLAIAISQNRRSIITTAPLPKFPTHGIPCTRTDGLGLTEIGELSVHCKLIIGVATGPMWPCFNIWNKDVERIIFLDDERLNFFPDKTTHCRTVVDAARILSEKGWLK